MREILRYYQDEASGQVADRFFQTFIQLVERAAGNPTQFHAITPILRRADLPDFPYHFLYRPTSTGIRVLVLRHNKRHPTHGLKRH
jgi:plasmid stabilization system protein ParE